MAEEKVKFTVRIPAELHAKIKEAADNDKRSVIKEIEFILDKYFAKEQK